MNLLDTAARLVDRCRPIRIAPPTQSDGNRLGGMPPVGVLPSRILACTEYFATLCLGDAHGTQLSIFVTADSWAEFFGASGKLVPSGKGPIELIIHRASPRAISGPARSSLSEQSLAIGEEINDAVEEQGMPYGGHKIGGAPFYFHYWKPVLEDTRAALGGGYFHLLQMNFPSRNDAGPRGSWPFGEQVFHMFARRQGDRIEFLTGFR